MISHAQHTHFDMMMSDNGQHEGRLDFRMAGHRNLLYSSRRELQFIWPLYVTRGIYASMKRDRCEPYFYRGHDVGAAPALAGRFHFYRDVARHGAEQKWPPSIRRALGRISDGDDAWALSLVGALFAISSSSHFAFDMWRHFAATPIRRPARRRLFLAVNNTHTEESVSNAALMPSPDECKYQR